MKIQLLALTAFVFALAGCSKESSSDWNRPPIPVDLVGIEAVNVDNSGEKPFVTASPIKKEAFMIGVKWITDNLPTDDDKFVSGSIGFGHKTYESLGENYYKSIVCLTPFNDRIPAGKAVSKYFKEINKMFVPAGIDEGFVLLVAPDPGVHQFRVDYYKNVNDDSPEFYYITPLISLF